MTNKLAIEALKKISDNVYVYERAQIRDVANSALASLSAEADEAVAWMWQHEETGSVGFIDPWQIENGWEKENPRLKLIKPLYTRPAPKDEAADELRRKLRSLDSASFKLTAVLCAIPDANPHGINEHLKRSLVMDAVMQWRQERDNAMKSAPIKQGDGK